jgi:hypothetical protein
MKVSGIRLCNRRQLSFEYLRAKGGGGIQRVSLGLLCCNHIPVIAAITTSPTGDASHRRHCQEQDDKQYAGSALDFHSSRTLSLLNPMDTMINGDATFVPISDKR